MKKITTYLELNEAISLLEIEQNIQKHALNDQLKTTYESLKPVNLIKSAFKELTSTNDVKDGIINSSIGIGAGYLTKKIIVGSTHNPIKQILGTLLQLGITKVVSRNGNGIKVRLVQLASRLFTKKNPSD